jgi:hypothetical protein
LVSKRLPWQVQITPLALMVPSVAMSQSACGQMVVIA